MPQMYKSAVQMLIAKLAAQRNISPQTALAIAQIESSFDPNSNYNKKTQYKGLYQIGKNEWNKYGQGKDIYNPVANTSSFLDLYLDNKSALEKSLGRDATAGELYLAHQQGIAGATALINNPDKNAIEIMQRFYKPGMARKVILGNGGNEDMTGRDFAQLWINKHDRFAKNFKGFWPEQSQVAGGEQPPSIFGTQSTPAVEQTSSILGTQSTPAAVRSPFPNTYANINLPQPVTMFGTQSSPAPARGTQIAGGGVYGPPPPPVPTAKQNFANAQGALSAGIGLLAQGLGANAQPVQMLGPSIHKPEDWEGFQLGLLG